MKKGIYVLFAISLLVGACGKSSGSAGAQTPAVDLITVKAQKTTDFLNSIGVNSTISRRAETLAKTIECIKYMGIRWVRTGYESGIPVEDCISVHKQTGAKISYGLLSGGTDIPRLLSGGRLLAAENALLAFEGANEPNNWRVNYQGEEGGGNLSWLPVAKLQRDLYAAVKGDAGLKDFPVWTISESGAQTDNVGLQFLTIPAGASTLMPAGTKYADYANCHNYIMHPAWPGLHDNQAWLAAAPGPECKVDGLYGNHSVMWLKKYNGYGVTELETLPKVTTETGLSIGGDITEEKHGTLLLNTYLAQFKRNWSYTAVYLLRDRSDEGGNQTYGFYKPDYTPRKAAVYLHNLTTILSDAGLPSVTSTLTYGIAGQPETVHDLLLQNSNGKFQLVVWGERVSGSDKVTVVLKEKADIKIYNPTNGDQAVKESRDVTSFTLELTDHPLIIEL